MKTSSPSIQLRKEVRLITPEWITALILATSPLVCFALGHAGSFRNPNELAHGPFPMLLLYLGCAIVATAVFGKENLYGTTNQLLTQPTLRSRIWQKKILLALSAIASIVIVYILAFVLGRIWFYTGEAYTLKTSLEPVEWVLICTVTPGLLFSTVLRSYHEAFWLTLLVPFAILVTMAGLAHRDDQGAWIQTGIYTYGILAFVGVCLRRQGWQSIEATSMGVSLPRLSLLRNRRKHESHKPHRHSPVPALIVKELRLQQLNYIITATFVAVYLIGTYTFTHGAWAEPITEDVRVLIRSLCLLIPASIGAAAIAEERAFGVGSWHQTLPVSPSRQWAIKLGTVLVLAAGISWVILSPLCTYVLSQFELQKSPLNDDQIQIDFLRNLVTWGGPILAALVGFCASALSRNYLQALITTAGIGLITAVLLFVAQRKVIPYESVPALPLLLLIVAGVLIPLCGLGSFRSFRQAPSIRTGLTQITGGGILAGLLITFLAQATMSRFWEGWSPEPSVAARPAQVKAEAKLIADPNGFTVLANSGALWHFGITLPGDPGPPFQPILTQWNTDNDWRMLTTSPRRRWAIKENGTLWTWPDHYDYRKAGPNEARRPTQVGTENDWQAIILDPNLETEHPARNPILYALKQDGRLLRHLSWEPNEIYTFQPATEQARFRSVAATGHALIGITTEGQLALVGNDPFGSIVPDPTADPRNTPPDTVTLLSQDTDWEAVHVIPNYFHMPIDFPFEDPSTYYLPERAATYRGMPVVTFQKSDGKLWSFAWIAHKLYSEAAVRDGRELAPLPDTAYIQAHNQDLAPRSAGNYFHLQANGKLVLKHRSYKLGTLNIMPSQKTDTKQISNRTDWTRFGQYYGSGSYVGLTDNDILWTWGRPIQECVFTHRENLGKIKILPYRIRPIAEFDLQTGAHLR